MKLIRDFTCAPEGHTVRTFRAGTVVDGRVLAWAIAAGAVETEKPYTPVVETKIIAPQEVKKKRPYTKRK